MSTEDEAGVIRVPDSRLYYDEELIYLLDGEPFTGVGYEYTQEHGKSEISYRNGMQDGPSRDWYPTGRLKAEDFYRENVINGLSRKWREDGTLVSEETYELGIRVRSKRFSRSGEVVDSYELQAGDPNLETLKRLRAYDRMTPVQRLRNTLCASVLAYRNGSLAARELVDRLDNVLSNYDATLSDDELSAQWDRIKAVLAEHERSGATAILPGARGDPMEQAITNLERVLECGDQIWHYKVTA